MAILGKSLHKRVNSVFYGVSATGARTLELSRASVGVIFIGWLAVDGGHVRFIVAFPGSRSEVVQPLDLLGAELDAVGGGVLLDAGDSLCAGIGAMSSPRVS